MNRHAFALLVLSLAATQAAACTLWGAAGTASADGTLLSKNRDWRPDHVQSLRLVHPRDGIAYVGLFADSGADTGLKGGVNAAGLSVVSAAASSLAKALRRNNPQQHGVMARILRQYHSLDEVNAAAATLFGQAKPEFLLLADANGLMQVETGQDGRYSITRRQQGTLIHTNHYLDTSLLNQPQTIGASSKTRLDRLSALLAAQTGPHTAAEFSRISNDRHDGPDNSLWRSGKEFTLANWQIALPAQNTPSLQLVIANPGEPVSTLALRLDATFWAQPARILAGNHSLPANGQDLAPTRQ